MKEKTFENAWNVVENRLVPPNASDEVREQIKTAFYIGASVSLVFACESDARGLNALEAECVVFVTKLEAGELNAQTN